MKSKRTVARKSIGIFTLLFLLIFVLFVTSRNFFNKKIINDDPDSRVVLNTIDNREYGMPYINPEWIEYNRLSEEEKQHVEVIPSKYIYDYKPVTNLFGTYAALPSRFNLRDEYATPIYDQGKDGLCWAYSTATMMESNLKVTKGISTRFSPNHMSFVTASASYFNENYNVYSEDRQINDGLFAKYYFSFNRVLLAAGVIPATNPLSDPFEDNFDITRKYNYDDIFNVNNFDYTVDKTVNFPSYENTEEYRNMIKSFIKKYGGVKVFMSWGRSGYYNEELGLHYEYDDHGSGHAVVIVGWDDNFTYRGHKGAWIFQNSYGKTEGDRIFYISYDMDPKGMMELTGIINMEERTWDNVYNYTNYPLIEYNGFRIKQELGYDTFSVYETSTIPTSNPVAVSGTVQFTYNKDKAKSEKLNSVNFISASQNGKYQVYISPNGDKNNYLYLGEVETDMPGIQTIKVTDNIILDSDKFSVKIVSSNGVFYQYANVFTNIVTAKDSTEEVYTDVTMLSKNNAGNYSYKLTTFLPDSYVNGEFLNYTVNAKYNDISHNLYSGKYYPYNGKSEVLIYIPYETPLGSPITVTIKDKDNKNIVDKFTFNYELDVYNGDMLGSGTEDDPYMVSTIKQLKLISEIPSAYYKLANDIDLSLATVDEQEEIYYLGWVSLDPFGGVLDGDGHSIKNIVTKSEATTYYGIFKELKDATIKNIIFENISSEGNFDDKTNNGLLANSVINTKINNVVVSCDINSRIKNFISSGKSLVIDGLTIYSNIAADSYTHSLIGVDNGYNYVNNLSIISNKVLKVGNVLQMKNSYFINTDKTDSNPDSYFANIDQLSNVYLYTSQSSNNENIHTFSTVSDFSSQSLENINFNEDVWTKVSDDALPSLKAHNTLGVSKIDGDTEYSLNIGEKHLINYRILTPDAFYKNVEFSIDDDNIAYIDNGYVIGRNEGTTNLHIKSTDGSDVEFVVTINVNNNVVYYFDYGDRKETIVLESGSSYVLPTESGNDKLLVGWLEHGINKYEPGAEVLVYSSKDFVAVYSDDLLVNSKYMYDKNKKIIKNLCLIDVDEFISGLNIPDSYVVKVFNGDDELTTGNIPTGSVTRIYKNNNLVFEYTNSVLGDVYPDGIINSRDAGIIIQYLLDIAKLNNAQLFAADFSKDEQIRLNDVELIKHYVVHDFDYYERMCPNEG